MSFGFSAALYPRGSSVPFVNLTRHVLNSWRHVTRAIGGYWSADCTISTDTMSRLEMQRIYNTGLGKTARSYSYGILTWEGEVIELELTLDGLVYRRTMDNECWHNKVKVQYRYPVDIDSNQGALAYNPAANSFQDDGQDFTDYETGAGTPEYLLTVYNDDDTFCYGYLGAAFTTANANDSIYVFTDLERHAGWNGTTAGKTPSTYVISNVEKRGTSQETAWTADSSAQSSINVYGYSEYIEVRGELTEAAATANRDRRLTGKMWPASQTIGGLSAGVEEIDLNSSLRIIGAGYVLSMNREFRESDTYSTNLSTQLTTLVGESQFVSAGVIDTNTSLAAIRGAEIPFRLWDGIEELIEIGDTSGNRWVGGVWKGRRFDYHLASTSVAYYWHGGKATDIHGVPIPPALLKPDRIVQVCDQPLGVRLPDGGQWHNPRNEYIEAVEFVAPRGYRLSTNEGSIFAATL